MILMVWSLLAAALIWVGHQVRMRFGLTEEQGFTEGGETADQPQRPKGSGNAILRARFKTAPIKQWEVSRAFNLSLKRHLDEAGLDLAAAK